MTEDVASSIGIEHIPAPMLYVLLQQSEASENHAIDRNQQGTNKETQRTNLHPSNVEHHTYLANQLDSAVTHLKHDDIHRSQPISERRFDSQPTESCVPVSLLSKTRNSGCKLGVINESNHKKSGAINRARVTSWCDVMLWVARIRTVLRHKIDGVKLSRRSYFWWHTCSLIVQLLTILLLPVQSSASSSVTSSSKTVVIEDFTLSERKVYNDGVDMWFHSLFIDSSDPQHLYLGAVDYVYKFDVTDISKVLLKSGNITQAVNFTSMYKAYVDNCRRSLASKNLNINYECRNHIRVVQPTSNNELYICSTGAYSPQEFYMDASTLQVTNVGYVSSGGNGGGSGLFKCPFSPDTPLTTLYSDDGNGQNAAILYSGTLVNQEYRYSIYRSNIGRNRSTDQNIVSLTTSDGKDFQKNDMNYVAAYDIDKYIYYFFREIANEFTDYDRIFVSRVGRICKNDPGGDSFTEGNFMTYVKTRIVCTNGQSTSPFYYNELVDVWFDKPKGIFYGLFRAHNGKLGSAVCMFDLGKINEQFDAGKFYVLDQKTSKWNIELDSKVPEIRPSSCSIDGRIPSYIQTFAGNHVLMYGSVTPILSMPPFQSTEICYSKMLVDIKQGYPVLYLYDDTRPSEITRMVLWSDSGTAGNDWKVAGTGNSRILSVLKPFPADEKPMWQMIMDKRPQKSWLYAVKDSSITQLSLDVCKHYTMCTSCVADPYCGWDSSSSTCVTYATGRSLIQNITNPLSACSQQCSKRIAGTSSTLSVIPETSITITCTSYCDPNGPVQWTLNNTVLQINNSQGMDANFAVTENNDLIILRATQGTQGIYRCQSNGVTLAQTSVTLKANDLTGIFLEEYRAWCEEFNKYKTDYKEWVCLKNTCLESPEKCKIDQTSIAACQKL